MQTIVPIEADFYRLIPSRFPPVAVYEGLVANDRQDVLVEVENFTNPRLRSQSRLLASGGAAPQASPRLQNWNLAPFAYRNPEGSRFFDQNTPALELADDCQTALAVSVARRELFLSRTNEAPIGLDMRLLKTPVRGRFLDLRDCPPDLPEKERWQLGDTMSEDTDGVLYRPPERPSATCVAIVRGSVLGSTIQTVHYRFVWNGEQISLLYAFDGKGQEIVPSELSSERDILAA